MKILALDYGSARIGVAIGDTNFGIAFARDGIDAKKRSKKEIFEKIKTICTEENIEIILIGKPLMLDGEYSFSTEVAEVFSELLQTELPQIQVELIDERFSTNIAQQRLNSGLAKQSKKKELIDSAAAQVILENYLGRLNK